MRNATAYCLRMSLTTNEDARRAAKFAGTRARQSIIESNRVSLRAWSHRAKPELAWNFSTLIRFCKAKGISLAGVERAYACAFQDAR